MGKLKKRSRSSKHRANPLSHNKRIKQNEQNETLRTKKVLPLISQLSASAPNDRSMALGSISVLAEDPKFRQMLLKEKILQILMEKSLRDTNDEIIVECLGLLRNLVIEEGYDVAVFLWRQQVWKDIESNLEKAKVSFDQLSKGVKDDSNNAMMGKALLFDYLENLITLIVGLGDTSEDIFEQIAEKINPIMHFLEEILTYGIDFEKKNLKISINLFNAILDLIYNFSTQSLEFTQSLSEKWNFDFDILDFFIKESPRCNKLSMVYMRGISLQLLDLGHSRNRDSFLLRSLQEILSIIQNIDINVHRDVLMKEIDNANVESLNKETKLRVESRAAFQSIELSLELITAIIEYAAFERNYEEAATDIVSPDFEIFLAYLRVSVSQLLVSLLQHLEFRQSSLTALNNLCWLFAKLNATINDATVLKLWNSVIALQDIEYEEKVPVSGVLWALAINDVSGSINIDDVFIEEVINDFRKTLDDTEVENDLKDEYLTGLVGFLGTIAKRQGNVERNLKISKFFIELLDSLPKISSCLTVEILDIFYEIFCDAEFDYDEPVFVNQGYLSKLEELHPAVKMAVKLIDKNKKPALKSKGEEVFNNLGKFIQYKRSERK